jgi:hypothetical protein
MRGRWLVGGIGLLAAALATGGADARDGDLRTVVFRLEWDHWLWLERVARNDPGYLPEGFDVRDRRLRMVGAKSAREAYQACGIRLGPGEAFFYGPETTRLVAKLGRENRGRTARLHGKLAAWRAGRTGTGRAGE